jgi:hypothetical protein
MPPFHPLRITRIVKAFTAAHLLITITEALMWVNSEGAPGVEPVLTLPMTGMELGACLGRVLDLRFIGRLRTIRPSYEDSPAVARLATSRRGCIPASEWYGIAPWFIA